MPQKIYRQSAQAPVRVKRCGKSAPHFRRREWQGKPRLEQDQIGVRYRGPRCTRVGCWSLRVSSGLEEWSSTTEPGLSAHSKFYHMPRAIPTAPVAPLKTPIKISLIERIRQMVPTHPPPWKVLHAVYFAPYNPIIAETPSSILFTLYKHALTCRNYSRFFLDSGRPSL